MCRPLALSPLRLVISMTWKPNCESTGADTLLSGMANAAESKAGSMAPLVHSPRSPPLAAETLSSDSRRATSANDSPPAIAARAESARGPGRGGVGRVGRAGQRDEAQVRGLRAA